MAEASVTKEVPVSAEKFFKAASDFTQFSSFVEGMKSAKLVQQISDNERRVAYEISMLGKDMSYVINLKDDPAAGKISWTLHESDFFKVNSGAWKIVPKGANACEVTYSLEVEFKFMVPGFILKNLVKVTLPSMLDSFAIRAATL